MDHDVVVGDTVHWFVRGNTAAPPLPGLVTVKHPGGMLSMTVFDENSVPSTKRSVWHKDSQQLKTSPKLAEKSGSWDFKRPVVTSVGHVDISNIDPSLVVNLSDGLKVSLDGDSAVTVAEPLNREGKEVAAKKALQKTAP